MLDALGAVLVVLIVIFVVFFIGEALLAAMVEAWPNSPGFILVGGVISVVAALATGAAFFGWLGAILLLVTLCIYLGSVQ